MVGDVIWVVGDDWRFSLGGWGVVEDVIWVVGDDCRFCLGGWGWLEM